MPKREYGKWSPQTMKRALDEYKKGNLGFNECCRRYEIPKPTFRRHLLGQIKRQGNLQNKRHVNGRLLALPEQVEEELVAHILKFEELLFGLTINDVRKLAYDVLAANPYLHNPFNKETKMAGKKWYYSFLSRHPNLSLRQPENISIARCKGFNRTNVYGFFNILEKLVDENDIDAFHIYNVDESGFSTVQKKSPKILASKGKHQVGFIASGERGINTTLVCCCNAAGNYIPPMIIFKRQRMHPALRNGCLPGSIIEISESGYINTDLFVKWLNHFIQFVKPNIREKYLLLLDGHTTHSKNLEAISLARDNGIILLQLPGHTTHRLQPLDVGVFKSMESNYSQVMTTWLRTNAGQKITQFEVTALLSEAYTKSATISNAVSGFKATGIWPVNRLIFTDADFIASENLEDIVPIDEKTQNGHEEPLSLRETNVSRGPSTSGLGQQKRPISLKYIEKTEQESTGTILTVSIAEVSPLPNATKKYSDRIKKGAQKAVVLTESPYKNDLEEKHIQKKRKDEKIKKKKEIVKKNVFGKENKTSTKSQQPSNIIIESNIEDWFCTLCKESVIEDMIQCTICKKWVHEMCADMTQNKDVYVCDLCP